ncbi:ATP-binding protein [Actinoplanes sp. CA-142083]|uniref:ATP-binding protein n=1 Tax=Actinoplanes sp. CA-142083 TaxID=3239903 RepID=UPI003D94DF69
MPPTRVADLLDLARARSFVGRESELATFGELLGTGGVLFLYGPGGIGKSSTLHQFQRRARSSGRTIDALDGREIDPSPEAFRSALGPASVLLIDGYEHLATLDDWLRREFLPSRAETDVVVLAGRTAPAAAWRTDPGWRSLTTIRRLDPLGPGESVELLARAGVPVPLRESLVELGRGHPLAMALLADAALTGTVPRSLADVPELITELLECLVREPPTDAHATGLATCATAWLTTEDLLRDTVGPDAPAVWEWLCRRPFITCGPRGLRPHELARDVLDASFERRSPDRYRELHRIIHDHTVAGIRAATGPDRQLRAQHLLYLHRRSPMTTAYHQLRSSNVPVALVPGTPDDHAAVVASSEPFAAEWLAVQPSALSVVRGESGLLAYIMHLLLPFEGSLAERDPVTRTALAHASLRPGERIGVARFLAGRDGSQSDLYAVLAGSVSSIIEWVVPGKACSYVTVTDPVFWQPMFDYLAFTRDFEVTVDGVSHIGFGMDWRRLRVDDWLDLMNEREHSGGTGPPPASLLRPPPLDQAAFATAVRNALHDLPRASAGPLAGTALGPDPRAAIISAIGTLGASPKGGPLQAVLNRTYLKGAPSQEAAASVLGLPFSTYRRHLAKAVDSLIALLWAAETGQDPAASS